MDKLTSNIGYATAFIIIAVAGILIPKGAYFVVGNLLEVIPRDDFFLYYYNLKFLIPITGIFTYFLCRQFNFKSQPFKFGWYDGWFLAFISWVFISGFWAKNPIVTINVGFSWLFLYSVFKFFEDFCSIEARKVVIIHMLLIVLALTLIPIFSFFFITGYSPDTGQLSFSSNQLLNIWSMFFTHRNYCSSIILLFAGLPLYWLFKSKKWHQTTLAVFLLALIFVSLLLLRSRGALLAFFTICSVVLVYNIWSKVFSWKIIIACVLLFTALFKGVIELQHDQQHYLLLLDPLHGINSLDGDDRLELWQISLQLFKENPVIGYGAGNWQFEYMKYGAGDLKYTNYTNKYLGHPHNFFIDVLFSNGVIGFVLFFIFFAGYPLVWGLKKVLTKNLTKTDFVCFAGIVGYIIATQFYGAAYITIGNFVGQATLFFAFIGFVKTGKSYIRNFLPAFLMVCISLTVVGYNLNNIFMLQNYDLFKKALKNKNYFLSQYIVEELENNPMGFMGYNYIVISTDKLWCDLYKHANKPVTVKHYIEKWINKDPYNFNLWYQLGNTLYKLGDLQKAVDCYKKVLLYNCDFIPAKIKLLELYERNNELNEASRLWTDLNEIEAYLRLYKQYENRWQHFGEAVNKKEDFILFKKQINNIAHYCDYQ